MQEAVELSTRMEFSSSVSGGGGGGGGGGGYW